MMITKIRKDSYTVLQIDECWRFFIMTVYHFVGIKGTGMSALSANSS